MIEIYGHPIKCHEHDYEWVKEQLNRNPYKARNLGIMDNYSKVYSAFNCPIFEQGKCRREANRRLLTHINKLVGLQK